MPEVARVLLDSPVPQLDRLFDYALPPELREAAVPGVRVRVPLRSAGRLVDGYLVERVEHQDTDRPLSDVEEIVSSARVLPDSLYRLARKVADRAAGSASDILRLVIPKRMVRAEKAWAAAGPPPSPEVAVEHQDWATTVLAAFPGMSERIEAGERLAVDAPPRPAAHGTYGAWAELLAALAIHTLARGKSALIVVPDYRDREQVEAALAPHAPEGSLVRNDAARSGPERYRDYLRLIADVPAIVVGNRSTVYAPAHDLGLVMIWDDGDSLLAEPLSPGVHARDAALVRQELTQSALVLAGHTRTSEVERLVQLGWVREVPAARRESPAVQLSAVRENEQGVRIPSSAYAAAREALRQGPVLVQVSRPGYAPVLVCADCRTPARCAHCAGPLRVQRAGQTPECAWCGRAARAWSCGTCGSHRVRMASSGSERTADDLGRAFAGTRVIVADGDHPVTHVGPEPALVVATRGAEPTADGGYRAILLLDGDKMLLGEQLRIGESCLRWWSNAAALAAPGAPVHLVSVTGPVARALATWTQPAYARSELSARAPLRLPPTVRVAAVEGTRKNIEAAVVSLRDALPSLSTDSVLGPVDTEDGARALIRFDYAQGTAVAASLRSSVVAAALRGRRGRGAARTTLRVRLDVPEMDL